MANVRLRLLWNGFQQRRWSCVSQLQQPHAPMTHFAITFLGSRRCLPTQINVAYKSKIHKKRDYGAVREVSHQRFDRCCFLMADTLSDYRWEWKNTPRWLGCIYCTFVQHMCSQSADLLIWLFLCVLSFWNKVFQNKGFFFKLELKEVV